MDNARGCGFVFHMLGVGKHAFARKSPTAHLTEIWKLRCDVFKALGAKTLRSIAYLHNVIEQAAT